VVRVNEILPGSPLAAVADVGDKNKNPGNEPRTRDNVTTILNHEDELLVECLMAQLRSLGVIFRVNKRISLVYRKIPLLLDTLSVVRGTFIFQTNEV